jgi:hypothetical protein
MLLREVKLYSIGNRYGFINSKLGAGFIDSSSN